MKKSFFVFPRYTPGCPFETDQNTAEKKAQEESNAYQFYLRGAYGWTAKERALKLGLAGIVEVREIDTNQTTYFDLITNDHGNLIEKDGDITVRVPHTS
jgi:hypothetical protein